jgi:tetratricopeptide (TPR) repeat protein
MIKLLLQLKGLNKFMKKSLIILIVIFLPVFRLHSQITDEKIQSGLGYIYHLKFDSANIVFNGFINSESSNPLGYFGQVLIEWWKINLDISDLSNDENFYSKVDKVIEICDNKLDDNENDADALLFKGGALGFRGLVKAIRDSYLKSAEDGKKSLQLLMKVLEMNPNNKDALFGIGVYNYYADKIPEEKPVLKPLTILFPKGDKAKGLLQLKEAAESSRYSKIEARNSLARIDLNYEQNYSEAEKISTALYNDYPENPVFEKYLARSYILNYEYDTALYFWKFHVDKFSQNKPGYTSLHAKREGNYYIALCYQRLGRILEAEPYLAVCEELTKSLDNNDTQIGVYTYLMLGWLYDKKGDRGKADYYYDKVISSKDFNNSRKSAEDYKKNRYN